MNGATRFLSYVDKKDFELIQIDTDWLRIAISGESLHNIVRPELRKEFETKKSVAFLGQVE